MKDYREGKIYKLVNDVDDEVYIGSTIYTLNDRFCKHKWDATSRENGKSKLYNHMNNLGYEHFKIDLIEDYPCNNKYELEARESELIKKFGTLNIRIEDRTPEERRDKKNEYQKKYREQNKNKIKLYYERNKEMINEKKREKITCSCGVQICKENLSRHQRTPKHKEAIKTMELEKN